MGCGMSKHASTSSNTQVFKPIAASAVEKDEVSGLRRAAMASDLDPESVKEATEEAVAPEESPAPAPRELEPEPEPD